MFIYSQSVFMKIKAGMDMTEKLKKVDRILLELLTGVLIFGICCQAAGLPFPIQKGKYAIGLWLGVLLAGACAFHMWRSLNKAFLCDTKSAARLMAGGYALRYLVICAFLLVLYFTDAGYVLAGFLGVMGLKAAAYLQPVTHKFYNRIFHETDPVPQPVCEEDGESSDGMDE